MRLKAQVSRYLAMRSIRRHRSRIGWRRAYVYSDYLARCRREAPADAMPAPAVAKAATAFERDGITSFWTEGTAQVANAIAAAIRARESHGEQVWRADKMIANASNYVGDPWLDHPGLHSLFAGDLGDFLKAAFGTEFKILYGALYRTVNDCTPLGSQLWHSDSGPGICINVMFYLHDTTPAEGPLQALDWETSVEVYEREKAALANGALERYDGDKRDRITAFYSDEIDRTHSDRILQPCGPAGLVVPFLNNTLHRGGFPQPGHTRTALVFHCYPSHRPTDLGRYDRLGIAKSTAYPSDPAAEF